MDIFALSFLESVIVAVWVAGVLFTVIALWRQRSNRAAVRVLLALLIPPFGACYAVYLGIKAFARQGERIAHE